MARRWNPFRYLRDRSERVTPRAADRSDADLERFFTDAIEARDRFKQLIASTPLTKRVVVVYGIGAVGKSSLLRMYRLYGHRADVPVCLVGGEETPSAVDLLSHWAKDLSEDGLRLPRFDESIRHYREIQAKVDQAAREAGQAEAEAAQKLGEAALKGGLEVLAAVVPGGALIEAVGSEAIGPLLNLLRAKLSKPDFDLYIDPVARLTNDFLTDLQSSADERRTVVMLDTFEQVSTLSAWLADTIQRLPEEVLAVVAGRELPDWEHPWPGWVASAELIELRELSDADMEELVQATYRLYDRAPTQDQVHAIVRFARGLPMAARTIIHLSIVHGSGDLSPSDPRVVADLADKLLSDVPQGMRPAFEAAAVLRYFQLDSLRALLGDMEASEAETLYRELARWPFVRAREGGLAVHDTMRDVINDAVRTRSPERFRTLQRQAAGYYAREADRATGEERDRLVLEGLYHAVRAEETDGVKVFQGFAEQLTRNQMVGRLRTLLTDAETYPLQSENSRLWRRYYAARLDHMEGRLGPAESVYREIGDDARAEPMLRAYALSDLGSILDDLDRLSEPDGERRAEDVVRRSFELQPELDVKIAHNFVTRMNLSNARADWDQSLEHIEALRRFAEQVHDDYELARAERLRAANHALRGDWGGYLDAREHSLNTIDRLGDVPALRMEVAYFTWPLTFMGRCHEALDSAERALELGNELQEKELMITILESVALTLGMQDRFEEARGRFGEAMNFFDNVYGGANGEGGGSNDRYIRATLSFRGLVSLREGSLDPAHADLQRALEIKRTIADRIGTPEMHVWLGQLHELRSDWEGATSEYRRAVDLRDAGRAFFQCAALTGLVRTHRAQGADAGAEDLLPEAEQIAIRYEYNDLLASLRLSEGYMAWDSELRGRPNGSAAATGRFREALVHGLRYNRFLLDEVLSGREAGSMLRPIIAACQERGAEGRSVLESLHGWWDEGKNAVEGDGGRSISSVEIGLSLKEAERIARDREPGSGAAQRSVIEQLDQALS